jgi:GNAT superfamily N-acetyltransferase
MNINITDLLHAASLNLKIKGIYYFDSNREVNGGFFRFFDVDTDKEVARFKLTQMEGCNGICILSKMLVFDDYKGKGYGYRLSIFKELLAKEMQYSLLMCTVIKGNIAQEKIMAKNKWELSNQFLNLKTNNNISIYQKKI